MALYVVRNDITKMNTEAIVNTASTFVNYGSGVDMAIYKAAGETKLLELRKTIGPKKEGEVFITPGFDLPAKYIIHAVSPLFIDGDSGEEDKLRKCYRNALLLAKENNIGSIAFPLISTGSFGYPKADGLRIAMDECNLFLLDNKMEVYLVVFDNKASNLARNIYPELANFIDDNYVSNKNAYEYNRDNKRQRQVFGCSFPQINPLNLNSLPCMAKKSEQKNDISEDSLEAFTGEKALDKRLEHMLDPFGKYMLYLVEEKGKTSTQVQNDAWISKKVYSKINTNQETYHPDKRTAFQICVGLGLNLDETKDLIRRAGYDFSPSSIEDVIWSFFFEMDPEEYDIFDVSDALEKYGLKPIVVLESKVAQ